MKCKIKGFRQSIFPHFPLLVLVMRFFFFWQVTDQCSQIEVRKKCWRLINERRVSTTTVYKLRNPGLAVYSSSSSLSISPPLWAAEFFLLTCLLEVPRGLCMGTRRRNPGWPLEEDVPKDVVMVLNVQGTSGEEAEHEDEGLTLWIEE